MIGKKQQLRVLFLNGGHVRNERRQESRWRGRREGEGEMNMVAARSLAGAVQGTSPASERWAPNQAVDTADSVVQSTQANGCGSVRASDEDGTLAARVSRGTAFQAAVKRGGRKRR